MKRALAFAVLMVAVGAAACSGNDGDGSPGTPAADGLPAAIGETMERMAEVRGLEPVPGLQAELVPKEELPALLDSLMTDEDRELAGKLTTLYRLLGHFSEEQDYLTVYQSFGAEAVLGLYSPDQDTLWVVSSEGSIDFGDLSSREESTLAHELVHAIQDHHFDLDATYETVADNPDRNMAWTVVVEGDASWHQAEYDDEYLWRAPAGRLFAFGVLPQQADVPLTFIRELLFPYTAGEEWVGEVLDAGGREYLNSLLTAAPVGTVCILHLERCLDGFEPVEVSLPEVSKGLGDGWEVEWASTLGEFHTANWLDVEIGLEEAREAADGWAGDSFATYRNGGDSLLVMRYAFSSAEEAREFRAQFDRFVAEAGEGREFAVRTDGEAGVLIAIADVPGAAERALALLEGG